MERRLAAILAADVVGYSRLMERDEAGTLAALKSRRTEILQPVVSKHHGRIVKLMGDGVLVEFASAVNAVECAVKLQQAMEAANQDQPDDSQIVLRVGVNLGDVMVEGSDLYGDCVNVAARLESLAEPGSVCVSQTVFSHVRAKVDLRFHDLGEQSLKNIAESIRVYRVSAGGDATRARQHPGMPSKPSIAVLPFTNMSGDFEQEYFSDGITEDIITELSRFRNLFVIARNSSFAYKGKSANVGTIARELGVAYVLEGSVRRAGQRVRITAQLIQATSGKHIWAERYDRELTDIFAVQDDVACTITATLEGRIAASGAEQAKRRPIKDWVAYDYFLQGRAQYFHFNFIEAEPFFARAIELDDGYAQAYALRAETLVAKYWHDLRAETLERALDSAHKALSLDDTDPWCQDAMGFVLTHRGQRDLAGPYFDRAIALNPTDVQITYSRAWWPARVGRADEALESLDAAVHRDPFPPAWFWETRAIALLVARRYEDVIQALAHMNHFHAWDHAYVAVCHAYLNRPAEARAAASEVLRLDPQFTVSRYAQIEDYTLPVDLKHLVEGMRKAGLPE
jgi:adenylate cyclase